MGKKINSRILFATLLSLVDDVVILAAVIVILSRLGIHVPVWAIIILAVIVLAIGFIIFRSFQKNPQLGFDNMVGVTGVVVEPISRKGTVRINGELWFASSRGEKIEVGAEVVVIEQSGLKLTVIRKTAADDHFDGQE